MGASGGHLGRDNPGVLGPPSNLWPNQEAPREERPGKARLGEESRDDMSPGPSAGTQPTAEPGRVSF